MKTSVRLILRGRPSQKEFIDFIDSLEMLDDQPSSEVLEILLETLWHYMSQGEH